MDKFEYDVQLNGTAKLLDDVTTVKFGNGFEQRKKNTLVEFTEEWSVSRVCNYWELAVIYEFLIEHTVTPFEWRVTSFEGHKKYIAKDISRTPKGAGFWVVSWTMKGVIA